MPLLASTAAAAVAGVAAAASLVAALVFAAPQCACLDGGGSGGEAASDAGTHEDALLLSGSGSGSSSRGVSSSGITSVAARTLDSSLNRERLSASAAAYTLRADEAQRWSRPESGTGGAQQPTDRLFCACGGPGSGSLVVLVPCGCRATCMACAEAAEADRRGCPDCGVAVTDSKPSFKQPLRR